MSVVPLPPQVHYPDVERVEWLNKVMTKRDCPIYSFWMKACFCFSCVVWIVGVILSYIDGCYYGNASTLTEGRECVGGLGEGGVR